MQARGFVGWWRLAGVLSQQQIDQGLKV
jgi:hypothetical protein